MNACMRLLLWSLVNSLVHLVLYLGCMLCVSIWCARFVCKLSYVTHEHHSSHGIECHDSQCTKLADATSPSNDYLACTLAVCQHDGASQVCDGGVQDCAGTQSRVSGPWSRQVLWTLPRKPLQPSCVSITALSTKSSWVSTWATTMSLR